MCYDEPDQITTMSKAIFDGTRMFEMALHFNKGLAGSPGEAINQEKNTAINPLVLTVLPVWRKST